MAFDFGGKFARMQERAVDFASDVVALSLIVHPRKKKNGSGRGRTQVSLTGIEAGPEACPTLSSSTFQRAVVAKAGWSAAAGRAGFVW